jgi:molybdopterin converting factor small subunit
MSLIRVPAPLRSYVDGRTTVPIAATDLRSLPAEISAAYPALATRVLTDGAFGKFVNVFIDGEDARFLPPDTSLASVKVVELLPAVSGGAT